MSEKIKTSSITKKINRSWLVRLFFTLILVDIVLLLIVFVGWCYAAENQILEQNWQLNLLRSFSFEKDIVWYKKLDTMTYTFSLPNGVQHIVKPGIFFPFVRAFSLVLLTFEGIFLLSQYEIGKKRVKKLLLPIEKITREAKALSNKRLDFEKLHELENVLTNVDPLNFKSSFTTGAQELTGLEESIHTMVKKMQANYIEQGRFVSDASHELRTPLSVISGYADMLSRWGKTDEKILDESIEAIQSETAHMQKLVEQLLLLARFDSARAKLSKEQTNLTQLVSDLFEEYQMIEKNHLWRIKSEDDIYAFADKNLIKQCFRILIDNAIKYSKKGDLITLKTGYQKGIPYFQVQDNGQGIKKEALSHIFERFYREDSARTRKTGGTGLGLSIAKWIVDEHKGYFDIFSKENIGTRITVFLPEKEKMDTPIF